MRRGAPAQRAAGLGPRERLGLGAALAVIAALQAVIAWRTPVGSLIDDSVYLLLARALRHGAYSLPDGFGRPVTSYWPGAPALYLLPAWLCEPRWGLCRVAALAASWTSLGLTWLFARRFLAPRPAAAVLLLVAANPVLAAHAGACASDVPFMALGLAAFCALPRGREAFREAPLVLAAAAAGLMRPEGALLVGSLALAVGWREGWARGLRFAALALLPAAAWLLRNHLASGTASDYLRQMGTQMSSLWDWTTEIDQVLKLCGVLFGRGLLGLSWDPAALAGGALALGAAGAGAVARLRREDDPRVLALACYALAALVLHLLWWQAMDRYLLPLLPAIWVLILFHLEDGHPGLWRRPRVLTGAAATLLAFLAAADARALPDAGGPRPWPETMDWVEAHVPPGALVQSLAAPNIMLWTGRPAVRTFDDVSLRDHWLAMCLHNRVEYVVLDEDLTRWRHLPGPWLAPLARLNLWVDSSPYVSAAFRSERERTAVYRIRHPDPARYLRAWSEFRAGVSGPRAADPAYARARLREAVRLEPRLGIAWAALAALDPEPLAAAERRRAALADPTLTPPAPAR